MAFEELEVGSVGCGVVQLWRVRVVSSEYLYFSMIKPEAE